MKDTKYELLVVIANQGYTEMIMEAARKASATGGTVASRKGNGHGKSRDLSRRFSGPGEGNDFFLW